MHYSHCNNNPRPSSAGNIFLNVFTRAAADFRVWLTFHRLGDVSQSMQDSRILWT